MNIILIASAASVAKAATACIEEMRAVLPWSGDHDIWQVIAPSSAHTAEDGESWVTRSKEREEELRAASDRAREVFAAHESRFADVFNPVNRVVVGYENTPMGGGKTHIRLYAVKQRLFYAAVAVLLTKRETATRHFARVMEEFVGAADYALAAPKQ